MDLTVESCVQQIWSAVAAQATQWNGNLKKYLLDTKTMNRKLYKNCPAYHLLGDFFSILNLQNKLKSVESLSLN